MRPKYYSGKKKKYTIKTQIIIEKESKTISKTIIGTNFACGKTHDFRLFKESKIPLLKDTKVIVDTGYQGLQKMHRNVLIPHKKTKKKPLNNRLLAIPDYLFLKILILKFNLTFLIL